MGLKCGRELAFKGLNEEAIALYQQLLLLVLWLQPWPGRREMINEMIIRELISRFGRVVRKRSDATQSALFHPVWSGNQTTYEKG